MLGILAVAVVLAMAPMACGTESGTAQDSVDPGGQGGTAPSTTRYVVAATVIDDGRGPLLCGAVAESHPPQCSGPPIGGWDWEGLDHDASGRVRWGDYRLVGTWDGTAFTVTEPPNAPGPLPPREPPDFSAPCPEPDGGWPSASTTLEQLQAFRAVAQEPPDFAGMWVESRSQPADPGRDVTTVAYTGDVEAHRARLEAIWPGPLCVVQASHSLAELHAVHAELLDRATLAELGVHQPLGSYVDERTGTVHLGVLVAEPGAQDRLNERFGDGVVEVTPTARPLTP